MHYLAGAGDGQTPLDLDEAKGLIPSWVATRADLDRVEQDGVARAIAWTRRRGLNSDDILSEPFLRQLHARMFSAVWSWAGHYRGTVKNIGVDPGNVTEELVKLIRDAQHWIEQSMFTPDETAVRFHHRLVWIHPFSNGNGRHSRLAADLLVQTLGEAPFTWGASLAADPVAARAAYIEAVRKADAGEIEPLLAFARR